MGTENLLVWNVWVLNFKLHQDALRELVAAEKPSIVRLQETKLVVISDFNVVQLLGVAFNYAFLPTIHTRGGILVAWRLASWAASSKSNLEFLVLVKPRRAAGGDEWWLTTVYVPTRDAAKPTFLAELHQLRQIRLGPWLLMGDFNMIYMVADKNNNLLNCRLMG
jgi:exonuclease III